MAENIKIGVHPNSRIKHVKYYLKDNLSAFRWKLIGDADLNVLPKEKDGRAVFNYGPVKVGNTYYIRYEALDDKDEVIGKSDAYTLKQSNQFGPKVLSANTFSNGTIADGFVYTDEDSVIVVKGEKFNLITNVYILQIWEDTLFHTTKRFGMNLGIKIYNNKYIKNTGFEFKSKVKISVKYNLDSDNQLRFVLPKGKIPKGKYQILVESKYGITDATPVFHMVDAKEKFKFKLENHTLEEEQLFQKITITGNDLNLMRGKSLIGKGRFLLFAGAPLLAAAYIPSLGVTSMISFGWNNIVWTKAAGILGTTALADWARENIMLNKDKHDFKTKAVDTLKKFWRGSITDSPSIPITDETRSELKKGVRNFKSFYKKALDKEFKVGPLSEAIDKADYSLDPKNFEIEGCESAEVVFATFTSSNIDSHLKSDAINLFVNVGKDVEVDHCDLVMINPKTGERYSKKLKINTKKKKENPHAKQHIAELKYLEHLLKQDKLGLQKLIEIFVGEIKNFNLHFESSYTETSILKKLQDIFKKFHDEFEKENTEIIKNAEEISKDDSFKKSIKFFNSQLTRFIDFSKGATSITKILKSFENKLKLWEKEDKSPENLKIFSEEFKELFNAIKFNLSLIQKFGNFNQFIIFAKESYPIKPNNSEIDLVGLNPDDEPDNLGNNLLEFLEKLEKNNIKLDYNKKLFISSYFESSELYNFIRGIENEAGVPGQFLNKLKEKIAMMPEKKFA